MKKLLSIILAAAMLFALVPSVFAEGETEEFTGYEYVFNTSAVDVEGSNERLSLDDDGLLNLANMAKVELDDITSGVSAPWKPASHNYISTAGVNSKRFYFRSKRAHDSFLTCFALELDVKNGGAYLPSMSYRKKTSSPIIDVYLVKAGTISNETSTVDFNFPATAGTTNDTRDKDLHDFLGGSDESKHPDAYKLGTIDMYYSETRDGYIEYFGNKPVFLDDNSSYSLIFHIVGKHENCAKAGSGSSAYYDVNIASFTLTYAPEKVGEEFDYEADEYVASDNATVTALAAYGNGEAVEDSDVISVGTVTYGETCTVSVKNETVTKGDKTYNFSHWARGAETGANRQALSNDASFAYMPSEGNNILIAVYEEAGAEKEAAFYNYNGQLLTDLEITDNKLPSLPSMAGFDEPASKWVQLGTETEFDAEEDVSELSGDKVFMAKYGDKKSDISITVNGVKNTYAYGDLITCALLQDKPEGQVFMYWTKTVNGAELPEIVSTEESYSFYAWEDCTVTAVYGASQPELGKTMRKIIISSVAAGNENAIMAEFVGFNDALEKGVMINGRKIAMTTNNSQFTVVKEAADVAVGYAIVSDGAGGYEIVTD